MPQAAYHLPFQVGYHLKRNNFKSISNNMTELQGVGRFWVRQCFICLVNGKAMFYEAFIEKKYQRDLCSSHVQAMILYSVNSVFLVF